MDCVYYLRLNNWNTQTWNMRKVAYHTVFPKIWIHWIVANINWWPNIPETYILYQEFREKQIPTDSFAEWTAKHAVKKY